MPAEQVRDVSRSPRRAAAAQPVEVSDKLKQMEAKVVNLEKRPDRWERCEAMLKAELPWLKFEKFRASYGKEDPIPEDQVAKKWNTANNSLYGNYEDTFAKDGTTLLYSQKQFEDPGVEYFFSDGERGCAHSHYRLWQIAAGMPGPLLVLEDDVKLVFERSGGNGDSSGATFTAQLEKGFAEAEQHGADVLYLGWSGFRAGNFKHLETKPGDDNPLIRRVEYVWTTVAYVLWPAGAKKLLAAAQPLNQPVDNFMAWEAREGRLKSFVLLDEGDADDDWSGGIVDQLDFQGDTDITKSDGGEQDDDPTVFMVNKTGSAKENTANESKEESKAADKPADDAMGLATA